MKNPFEEAARDLAQKRERWDRLITAKGWITQHYEPLELEVVIKHQRACAMSGHAHAMELIGEIIVTPHSKEEILARIDGELTNLNRRQNEALDLYEGQSRMVRSPDGLCSPCCQQVEG